MKHSLIDSVFRLYCRQSINDCIKSSIKIKEERFWEWYIEQDFYLPIVKEKDVYTSEIKILGYRVILI